MSKWRNIHHLVKMSVEYQNVTSLPLSIFDNIRHISVDWQCAKTVTRPACHDNFFKWKEGIRNSQTWNPHGDVAISREKLRGTGCWTTLSNHSFDAHHKTLAETPTMIVLSSITWYASRMKHHMFWLGSYWNKHKRPAVPISDAPSVRHNQMSPLPTLKAPTNAKKGCQEVTKSLYIRTLNHRNTRKHVNQTQHVNS